MVARIDRSAIDRIARVAEEDAKLVLQGQSINENREDNAL